MYRYGTDEDDRLESDNWFKDNMYSLIAINWLQWEWLVERREKAADFYYNSVRLLGKDYFNKRRHGEIEYG
jgi:hypothetical protein